jgi:ABC-type nitrate/sulfonate/bicarbonate transport system substrate-binding protein
VTPLRLAVPDLVSNSYFPAIAAVEMGYLAEAGFEAHVELIFPVSSAMDALRRGDVDLVAGAAHATLTAFPEWRGAKLLAALARHMYWFLVVRADLGAEPGDVEVVKGLRIGAAPGVDLGLRQLLVEAGIDPDRDVNIMPVPGLGEGSVSFGVNAAAALREGRLDGFWANGMGAEVAVRERVGSVVLDVRRGDGPARARNYTFGALVATDSTLRDRPVVAACAVRGLVRAQIALRDNPERATRVGQALFPPKEAELVAELVARDAVLRLGDPTRGGDRAQLVRTRGRTSRRSGRLCRRGRRRDAAVLVTRRSAEGAETVGRQRGPRRRRCRSLSTSSSTRRGSGAGR